VVGFSSHWVGRWRTECNKWTVKRIWIAVIAGFIVAPLSLVIYDGVQTLRILTVVERDRDRWQRPSDILRTLAVEQGNVVVDLGSGAGYFALKLSPMVGRGASCSPRTFAANP
jgi:hypothetical protein